MLIIEDVTVNMKGKTTKIAGHKVINLGQVVCLNANVNIGRRRRRTGDDISSLPVLCTGELIKVLLLYFKLVSKCKVG